MGYLNEINSLSDEVFSIESEIEQAKENFVEYNKSNKYNQNAFDDNQWAIYNEVRTSFMNFDFEKIDDFEALEGVSIRDALKCWLVDKLENHSVTHSYTIFNYVLRAIEKTNYFEKEKLDDFVFYIEREMEGVDETKMRFINSVLNFMSFIEEHENFDLYTKELSGIRSKLNTKDVVRVLPSSKDILKFSWSIEKFRKNKNLIDQMQKEKWIYFFPVVLWWELTTIIPLRASEFCSIKRDCLFKEGGECYITLPREKKSKAKTVRMLKVEDKIKIDEDIYNEIASYIEITEEYGETETLFSYKAVIELGRGNVIKKNKDKFALNNFKNILDNFYLEYVNEDHVENPISQKLKPNDTRHLAFMSLMMQGVHPIEIARLGGHSDIKAQYHYQQHQEYWIDSEVEKIMNTFDINGTKKSSFGSEKVKASNIDSRFRLMSVMKNENSDIKKKLNIGYCTDEMQRCETECFFCPYWGITKEEFEEKGHLISEKRKEILSSVTDLSSFMLNIYKDAMNEEYENRSFNEKNIMTLSKKIKDEVYKLAKLDYAKGGNSND